MCRWRQAGKKEHGNSIESDLHIFKVFLTIVYSVAAQQMYLFNINTSVNLVFFLIVSRTKLLVRRFFLFGQQKTVDWSFHTPVALYTYTFPNEEYYRSLFACGCYFSPWPNRWCKSVFCLTFGLCIYFYLSNLKFRLLTIADSFFIYLFCSFSNSWIG